MANVHRLFDNKDDEDDKETLYTGGAGGPGGSGGSGMAVYGPPGEGGGSPRGGSGDVFDRLVSRAQAGAEAAGGGEPPMGQAGGGRPGAQTRTITLYSNGFTVDDGPLREPNTAENQKFLDELLKGLVPSELKPSMAGGILDVALADKRGETYVPPAYVAFSGGATLGTSAPVSGDAVFTDDGTRPPRLNESEPSTTVQVKTSDGKKLRLKLNTAITVRQLAAAIRNAQEGAGPDAFSLSAGFPPKDLADGEVSLKDAGLAGASIVQKSV